jgi:hypothetical protein
MGSTQRADGDRAPLPAVMEMALREMGVMPAAPLPVERTYGVWYKDGEIPH